MRYFKTVLVGTAASLALCGSPAHAQEVNDVRCLLASNMFVKDGKDPKAEQAADAAKYFYLGRMEGRFSPEQLKHELAAQQKAITAKNVGSIVAACFQASQRRARVVESTSKQIGQQKQ